MARVLGTIPERKVYSSLDEMAKDVGVEGVLAFLASQPTEVGEVYRHTNIPVVPYVVTKCVRPKKETIACTTKSSPSSYEKYDKGKAGCSSGCNCK